MKARLSSVMAGCCVFASFVLMRAAYIQVKGDPRLETMARRQFQSKVLIRPKRGVIFDRNGEALAINTEVKSLAANPSKIQNKKTLARLLAKALDIPLAKLQIKLKEHREFIWIKRHMSESDMNRLKKFRVVESDGDLMDGLWLVKEDQRFYPHGELSSHILGSVNLDSEGLEGVELWANDKMRGKVVSFSAIKDALGRPTFIDAVAAQHLKDGEPVQLTVDAALQYSVEQELHNAVAKANAKGGSVMVMNSVTGEILAMANEPSFNPNRKDASPDRRRNRVMTDGYEPGSTLKAVLLASAVSHGWKLSDQLWGEKGTFYVQGKKISEAEAKEKFEWVNLRKMIQVSSNIVAAKLALKVGADNYYSTLKTFGFGSKTGSGFPGEISGRLMGRNEWTPLSLANFGFGQGVLVTPIQMLRAYATFANGGFLVQPTFLKSPLEGAKHEAPKRIISQKVADTVTEALKSPLEEGGTGVKAKVDGYLVAGKTGTAQTVDPETGHYSRSRYISSFIGYPVGVDPKLVIFTSIDEPRGVYYASETAAPLFRAVLQAAVTRLSMPNVLARTPATLTPKEKAPLKDRLQWSLAKVIDPLEVGGTASDGTLLWKMPNLLGLTPREALRVLQGRHFQLEVHGAGMIQTQVPEAGKSIADGSKIRLNLIEP